MLLALLVYGYATGCFSSRKIERATYDSLAFRFIAANRPPDQDTLARFRRRFAKEIEASFVEVLQVARENRLARFGTLSLDGTKIHASASPATARSLMVMPRPSRHSSRLRSKSCWHWPSRPTPASCPMP